MKKILLEYANMFAYTFTGLIFGLAFFLLFINFYHMQELAQTVDVSTYNETTKASIEEKIETIRNNINVYNQSTYTGSLNIYGLNTAQAKLQSCLDIIESDTMMHYLELDEIGINDSYNFVIDYKNEILNGCLVMQIKSMFNTDTISTLPNFDLVKPYIDMNVDKYGNHIFTPEEIAQMDSDVFRANESAIMKQLQAGLIGQQIKNFANFTNPITGDDKIFSREDIGAMSGDEYSANESAIMEQLKSIGIPTGNELEASSIFGGGTVYVRPDHTHAVTEPKSEAIGEACQLINPKIFPKQEVSNQISCFFNLLS